MELFSFALTGHRRFKDRGFLRTNGKLVALIGANEAGKSTLIRALDDFDRDTPVQAAEFSRGRAKDNYKLVCKYLLDDEESRLEVAYAARTKVKLPKVELAYELLDLLDEKPGRPLLDARRRSSFGKIALRVVGLFADPAAQTAESLNAG
jgi:ATPase subunit of ABC transporter with duplicated ATPase domains